MHPKTAAVYAFIVSFKLAHDGVPPTIRGICDACAIDSTSHVNKHLHALEAAGDIRLTNTKTRSIEVTGGRWVAPVQEP
jgi:repressor LexA